MLGERLAPNMADFSNLKYVTRCVLESMRLYPHPPVRGTVVGLVALPVPGVCCCKENIRWQQWLTCGFDHRMCAFILPRACPTAFREACHTFSNV